MRLREPFSGYKLASGHYIFHIAFLTCSYLPMDFTANEKELIAQRKLEEAQHAFE